MTVTSDLQGMAQLNTLEAGSISLSDLIQSTDMFFGYPRIMRVKNREYAIRAIKKHYTATSLKLLLKGFKKTPIFHYAIDHSEYSRNDLIGLIYELCANPLFVTNYRQTILDNAGKYPEPPNYFLWDRHRILEIYNAHHNVLLPSVAEEMVHNLPLLHLLRYEYEIDVDEISNIYYLLDNVSLSKEDIAYLSVRLWLYALVLGEFDVLYQGMLLNPSIHEEFVIPADHYLAKAHAESELADIMPPMVPDLEEIRKREIFSESNSTSSTTGPGGINHQIEAIADELSNIINTPIPLTDEISDDIDLLHVAPLLKGLAGLGAILKHLPVLLSAAGNLHDELQQMTKDRYQEILDVLKDIEDLLKDNQIDSPPEEDELALLSIDPEDPDNLSGSDNLHMHVFRLILQEYFLKKKEELSNSLNNLFAESANQSRKVMEKAATATDLREITKFTEEHQKIVQETRRKAMAILDSQGSLHTDKQFSDVASILLGKAYCLPVNRRIMNRLRLAFSEREAGDIQPTQRTSDDSTEPNEIEELLELAEMELKEAQEKIRLLTDEKRSLSSRLDHLEHARSVDTAVQAQAGKNLPDNVLAALRAISNGEKEPTPEQVLLALNALYPERVRILPSAYSSSRDSEDFEFGRRLWSLMIKLITEYNAAISNGRCPPWRAKRRRVVPGRREATRGTRRAEGAKGDPQGSIRTRRPVIWETGV